MAIKYIMKRAYDIFISHYIIDYYDDYSDVYYDGMMRLMTIIMRFIMIILMCIDIYKGKADIVNALSIIHWIFSCTSIFGSMNKMISFLREITTEVLFIEWIDPDDEAIKYFKHLDYNKKNIEESYTYENFILELNKNFNSVNIIGETRSTRKLFKATI